MFRSRHDEIFRKRLFFVSGCPRSGTSFLVKVIDSHPDVGILMEQTFQNRRRLNIRAKSWRDQSKLARSCVKLFRRIDEPIIGNKVCAPDVWSVDDILQFCSLWQKKDIIWILRDPVNVLLSRHNREAANHYSPEAMKLMPLNFESKFAAWASSWNICVENYNALKLKYPQNTHLVYYEELVSNFKQTTSQLFDKLKIKQAESVSQYLDMPHYSSLGKKEFNLKYKDKAPPKPAENQNDEVMFNIEQSLLPYAYNVEKFHNKDFIS